MAKKFTKALFIFRRNLRLNDNTGLINACKQSEKIIPCFIFDPRQIGSSNSYRSNNAIQFMIESLQDLDKQLKKKKGKLYLFKGKAEDVIKQLIKKEKIDTVFTNRDYTPFSIKRDNAIKKICTTNNVKFIQDNDLLLTQPEEIKTGKGTPYSIFTPFYKKARINKIDKPHSFPRSYNFFSDHIVGAQSTELFSKILKVNNKNLYVNGGRNNGLKILNNINKFKDYAKTHDYPSISTTNLSAYLKFGCVSIREAYYAIKNKLGSTNPLLRQLYWRDFWTHVAYNYPFVFGQPYYEKYKKLWWSQSEKNFEAWCTGNTGFPIVDAGMRQLNKTGFMHNRVRMIVASFLTKDLHINWLKGEKYFAQQLVDYDPALNNGNWQWSASTGCDAQPYFRIFNPWTQQTKFDKNCEYIKKWIPELKDLEPKEIHNWFKSKIELKNYPKPIIDHALESKKAKALYKRVQ